MAARRARRRQPPAMARGEIERPGMAQMRPRTTRTTTMRMTKSHAAGRGIAPITAMRPPRQCSKQRQNQDHDQDCAKHFFLRYWFYPVQLRTRLHRVEPLQRDVDGYAFAGIPAVIEVITVVHVVDVDVVVVVPVVSPVLRPRVNGADPIALILEARVSAYDQEGQGVDAKAVARPKVSAIPVIRNAVTPVAAALLPVAVVGLPVL